MSRARVKDKKAVRVYLDLDLFDELERRTIRAREKVSSLASRIIAMYLQGHLVDPLELAARSQPQPVSTTSKLAERAESDNSQPGAATLNQPETNSGGHSQPAAVSGSPHESMNPSLLPQERDEEEDTDLDLLSVATKLARSDLNDWEEGFVRGVRASLTKGDSLTEDQVEKLREIHDLRERPSQTCHGNPGTTLDEIRGANAANNDGSTWGELLGKEEEAECPATP